MQWRKLFDLNPLYAVLSDKIAAREFVASRVGADLLSPLLWTGSTPEQIPFATLDPPYILKCNHGSGYNIIVSDRATLDIAATREKLRSWLATNYGRFAHEPGYMPVRPQLLAEQMMLEPDGTPPLEFKIFVFDGKPRMIHTIIVDRARERFDAFHDCDWRRLDWRGFTRHSTRSWTGRDGSTTSWLWRNSLGPDLITSGSICTNGGESLGSVS